MKSYLIQFYTTNQGNGYAIVNACNPQQASDILLSLGAYIDYGYSITSTKELPVYYGQDLTVVQEGITTHGLSAYELALQEGFKGSLELWIESLKKPAKEAANIVTKEVEQLLQIIDSGTQVIELVNDATEKAIELQLLVIDTIEGSKKAVINSLIAVESANQAYNTSLELLGDIIAMKESFTDYWSELLETELLRAINERLRQESELTRQSKETARDTAENIRVANDANRLTLLEQALASASNAEQYASNAANNAEEAANCLRNLKKGEPNGVASLNNSGKIPWSLLPITIIYE